VFVTDSAAKTIEWEKQYDLPGTVGGRARNNISTYALIATPDSGFIVAGTENRPGNYNDAVAFKFVPKPKPTSALPRPHHDAIAVYRAHQNAFVYSAPAGAKVELRLFDLRGQETARLRQQVKPSGKGRFDLSSAGLKWGVYLWELQGSRGVTRGTLVMAE
jgi:hypothetical protein